MRRIIGLRGAVMTMVGFVIGVGVFLLPGELAVAAEYDIVIRGGRVMDPETEFDGIRNVGIDGNIISAITSETIAGSTEIDVSGLIVAPGFIDLHAHDHNVLTHKLHAQDGVTTALELETGAFPVKKWYQAVAREAIINFGASVSHPVIRAVVMGGVDANRLTGDFYKDVELVKNAGDWNERASTTAERAAISRLLIQGLEEGGLGFGYHLAITPGASHGEMLDLYRLSVTRSVPNFVHVRSFGQVSPLLAGMEVVSAASSLGASMHIVHLNSSGLWETAELLDLVEEAWRGGLDVTTEAYPYTGAESSLDDPRIHQAFKIFSADFSDLEYAQTGERLTEERYLDLKKNAEQRTLIAHIMTQENVDAAMAHPEVIVASDGGKYVEGTGHPRGTGSFARLFSRYVRERKSLTLMQAIRKATLLPAKRLEMVAPTMKKRGRMQEGMIADITIFDADEIRDRASYSKPIEPSAGIAYVLVNGTFVVKDYHFQETVFPGQPIKGIR